MERRHQPEPEPSWPGFRIAFLAHLVLFVSTIALLFVLDPYSGLITALAWGIPLALHAFFALGVPRLRRRWVAGELERAVPIARADERRAAEGRHAHEVERLAAALAHEIRNPIAAAKSLLQQIAEDPSSGDAPEYARVAANELDRVEASIAHLLRFSREEPLRLGEVVLTELVASVLETTKEATSGIVIHRDEREVTLRADAEKLRRVIVNLVTNAADAARVMPAPRQTITIESGTSLDGHAAWIRVRDEGHGIPEPLRALVFEPWASGKESGTGLGLPIARKLCEAHGGSLEIEQTGSTGTSMLVTLPRDTP